MYILVYFENNKEDYISRFQLQNAPFPATLRYTQSLFVKYLSFVDRCGRGVGSSFSKWNSNLRCMSASQNCERNETALGDVGSTHATPHVIRFVPRNFTLRTIQSKSDITEVFSYLCTECSCTCNVLDV